MNRLKLIFTSIIISLAITSTSAQTSQVRPVVIGSHGEDTLDACLGYGEALVATKIMSAPSENSKILHSVKSGQGLYFCEDTEDGEWVGVLFSTDDKIDCKVTSPVKKPTEYKGPCKSGWVKQSDVELLAG